jgi:hypothetical protein
MSGVGKAGRGGVEGEGGLKPEGTWSLGVANETLWYLSKDCRNTLCILLGLPVCGQAFPNLRPGS